MVPRSWEGAIELAGGRYKLDALLGRGGMAEVYQATDTALGVERAIKILIVEGRQRDSMRVRLRDEARAMAQLAHPNILSIFDVGEDGDRDFVVMELAEGGSVADLLEESGALAPVSALAFTLHILSALAAAHARGIVHRDVKPQNMLLSSDGVALLADFGIAMLAGADHRATRTGVAMGSLSFMAPEQRLDARSVGPEADIYATAASLYNMLTVGNPVDLFVAPESSPRWLGIPDDILPILRKGVSYAPEDRYRTAAAMAQAVLEVLPDASAVPVRSNQLDPNQMPMPSETLRRVTTRRIAPTRANATATATAATFVTSVLDVESNTLVPSEEALAALLEKAAIDKKAVSGPTLLAPDDMDSDEVVAPLGLVSGPTLMAPEDALDSHEFAAPTDEVPLPVAPVVLAAPAPSRSRAMGVVVVLLLAIALAAFWYWPNPQGEVAEIAFEAPAASETESAVSVEVIPAEPETEGDAVAEGETDTESEGTDAAGTEVPEPLAVAPAAVERVVAPAPVAPAAPSGPPPLGRYKGSWNGRVATLLLTGSPEALSGSLDVSFMSNTISSAVKGSWDAGTRTVRLTDVEDTSDAGTYEAVLSDDDSRLSGRFEGRTSGRIVQFAFKKQ